jgi:hypothetical protein
MAAAAGYLRPRQVYVVAPFEFGDTQLWAFARLGCTATATCVEPFACSDARQRSKGTRRHVDLKQSSCG